MKTSRERISFLVWMLPLASRWIKYQELSAQTTNTELPISCWSQQSNSFKFQLTNMQNFWGFCCIWYRNEKTAWQHTQTNQSQILPKPNKRAAYGLSAHNCQAPLHLFRGEYGTVIQSLRVQPAVGGESSVQPGRVGVPGMRGSGWSQFRERLPRFWPLAAHTFIQRNEQRCNSHGCLE